jgi:SAM-dependent methyltransferase
VRALKIVISKNIGDKKSLSLRDIRISLDGRHYTIMAFLKGVIDHIILIPQFQDFQRTQITQFVASIASRIPSGALIVDAGAGEGWYRGYFSHANYIAIDYGIGDAKWDYSKLNVLCDLIDIPFKNQSVAFILCTQTLEHVQKPQLVVTEFYRVLSPGGEIFCTMPFLADYHHQEPYDYFRYTKYGVESLFRTAGFREIAINPLGGYYTLLVLCLQNGLRRLGRRNSERLMVIRGIVFIVRRVLTLLLRWMNRIAWFLDRKDERRYLFALGFSVIAKK